MRVILLAFASLTCGSCARAQAPPAVPRLTAPIILDGSPREPQWDAALSIPLVVYRPNFGATPSQPSDVRIAYDSRFIYVGARLFDSEPDGIQVTSLARDDVPGGDYFNVLLDTFNDNENAVMFTVTPGGARLDRSWQNDAEGPNASTLSWDAFWDARTTRDSAGWYVEMRIPFSTLRYETRSSGVVMGLIISRVIGRIAERSIFPAIPPRWPLGAFKPSMAQDIVFNEVPSSRAAYLTPYTVLGASRRSSLDTTAARWSRHARRRADIGADLKIGLLQNMTLDLTLNTDFAETQVDDERLNLTRFPLFFPEQRQFFLERAGVFEFMQSATDRLFHSRRIGLTDGGEPIGVLGGARLIGRISSWDIGLLNLQTDREPSSGSENFGVARVRRRLLNDYSTLGAMLTTRTGARSNAVAATDGSFRLGTRDQYLTFKWARMLSAVAPPTRVREKSQPLSRDYAQVSFELRSTTGLGYGASAAVIGDDYEPGIGFVQRRGIRRGDASMSFGVLQSEKSSIRMHTPFVSASAVFGNASGEMESRQLRAAWTVEARNGATIAATAVQELERLENGFALSDDAQVSPGDYRYASAALAFEPPPGWRLGASGSMRAGEFFDGTLRSFTLAPYWAVSPHLFVGADFERVAARFPARDQRFDATVARGRVRIYADTHLSLSTLVQYSTAASVAVASFRLRYNFRDGTDFWVAFTQSHNTERARQIPTLPALNSNSLLFKLTYAMH